MQGREGERKGALRLGAEPCGEDVVRMWCADVVRMWCGVVKEARG